MANTKLLTLMSEIITEVGDLQNIQPYQWTKKSDTRYDFNVIYADDTFRGTVMLSKLSDEERSLMKFNPVVQPEKADSIVNMGYTINGTSSQHVVTNFKVLIRILKTVSDIIEHQIQSFPNSIFTIFEESKLDKVEPAQKSKLYQAIMTQNMLPGYRGSTVRYLNYQGYSISPIYK
jgi:hypothetical protein